jgi:hypothetical protein
MLFLSAAETNGEVGQQRLFLKPSVISSLESSVNPINEWSPEYPRS